MASYWDSPKLWSAGDTLKESDFRDTLKSLETKLSGGITGDDFEYVGGSFQVNGSLDLMGHNLTGAGNVPTGMPNIKALGVLGDGVTDESDAIQYAFDRLSSAGYGAVFIPPGNYLVSRSIRIAGNMLILGSGSLSVLTVDNDLGSISFFRIEAASGYNSGVVIRDVKFDSTSITPANIGVTADGVTTGLMFENIYGGSTLDVVLNIVNCSNVRIDGIGREVGRLALSAAKTSLLSADAILGPIELSDCTNFSVSGVVAQNAAGHGALVTGCNSGRIQGSFGGCGKSGITLAGCNAVTIADSYAINNSYDTSGDMYPGIAMNACAGCSVVSSASFYYDGTSKQTYGVVVQGGTDNLIQSCVLTPNRGPDGTGTAVDTEYAVLNRGAHTIEIGNDRAVIY